ncbi:hypothetical protein KP509_29G049700 [Ceratopteris richardii]|uniref:Uncharacterized protein n=1 Tax=Ceratopteris richardii TaxID=49495 RepID=A0A8T2R811_CERRI|nr:hypothetical protein KP509_29G049700 [Ceratopteris richardii]
MFAELSSVAITAGCPPSPRVNRRVSPAHLLIRTSASLRWQVDPSLHKLRLAHQFQPVYLFKIPTREDVTEHPGTCSIFPDTDRRNVQLISTLLSFARQYQQKQESSERDDFYANMGSAIRIIREETPCLFYKDLDYSIYRDDITFRDPRNTFIGIEKYKLIFWALRFHGQMFFKAIWVEVLRIWQPSDRIIVVRWTVRGKPRVPWEAQGLFEGTSEYKLDENGKIYEHKVNNVAPSNFAKLKSPALLSMIPSAPHPTPTLTYFRRTDPLPTLDMITCDVSIQEMPYSSLTGASCMEQETELLVSYLV